MPISYMSKLKPTKSGNRKEMPACEGSVSFGMGESWVQILPLPTSSLRELGTFFNLSVSSSVKKEMLVPM